MHQIDLPRPGGLWKERLLSILVDSRTPIVATALAIVIALLALWLNRPPRLDLDSEPEFKQSILEMEKGLSPEEKRALRRLVVRVAADYLGPDNMIYTMDPSWVYETYRAIPLAATHQELLDLARRPADLKMNKPPPLASRQAPTTN